MQFLRRTLRRVRCLIPPFIHSCMHSYFHSLPNAFLPICRCVLAGDHLQLPPTIISSKAAKQGLEVTIMHRLLDLLGDKVVRMLTTQYRFVILSVSRLFFSNDARSFRAFFGARNSRSLWAVNDSCSLEYLF